MSTELLQAVAASNEWWALGPEIILACAALGLLVMEMILPRKDHYAIPYLAMMVLALVLVTVGTYFYTGWQEEDLLFGG